MKSLTYYMLCLVLISQIEWSVQQNILAEKKRLLDQLLVPHDARIRPAGVNGTDAPVSVKVNLMLRTVPSISDYDMEFGAQITLRQEWLDERLKFDAKGKFQYLTFTEADKIWTPDLFFPNEKDGHLHKIMAPNTYLRIYPSGLVRYSVRLSMTLACNMMLQRFPFDTQICSIKMASYGTTTDDLKFHWKEGDPVQVTRSLFILGFNLEKFITLNCHAKTNTGEYSCIKVNFLFKRDVSYYILHTFLPSSVLVVVSWASFWMDRRAVVARILLVLSTLFAMSSLATDIEASVPHVPYVKAMDLWAGMCFTFLLAALVEFAVVNATSSDDLKTNEVSSSKNLVNKSTDSSQTQDQDSKKDSRFLQDMLNRLPRDPSRIDSLARILFPSLFAGFVFLYFTFYYVFDESYDA